MSERSAQPSSTKSLLDFLPGIFGTFLFRGLLLFPSLFVLGILLFQANNRRLGFLNLAQRIGDWRGRLRGSG